jgi:hypothetical protein
MPVLLFVPMMVRNGTQSVLGAVAVQVAFFSAWILTGELTFYARKHYYYYVEEGHVTAVLIVILTLFEILLFKLLIHRSSYKEDTTIGLSVGIPIGIILSTISSCSFGVSRFKL